MDFHKFSKAVAISLSFALDPHRLKSVLLVVLAAAFLSPSCISAWQEGAVLIDSKGGAGLLFQGVLT